MSTAEMEVVELENVGPISGTFPIELTGPGLYELRGSKGTGKTTVLHALELLAGHKVNLTIHDGQFSGRVEGLGVVVPVGSKKRPRGKITVDTLEAEKFDLTDLIDPDGKTPETRDATRIKALASLCGLKISAEDFYSLAGGQEAYEALGVESTDDPILFASRVKKAIEREAKTLETLSETQRGHYESLHERARSVDLKGECDAQVLAAAVEAATEKLAALRENAQNAGAAIQRSEEAKRKLADSKKNYRGPSSQEAAKAVEEKSEQLRIATEEKQELERQLAEAKERLAKAQGEYNTSLERHEAAVQHENDIAEWEASIEIGISVPSDEELREAEADKQAAIEAQEEGVRIRDAKAALEKAEEHKQASLEAYEASSSLRARASGVFTVLMEKLKTKVIRIETVADAPRLVVDHPKRGKTLFDQENGLSDGERVRASIEELMPHLGAPGLFPVPQRTYQDLPPSDREELARYAESKGIFMFGAQVTDGELRVEKIG